MRSSLIFLFILLAFGTSLAFAQNGGYAGPKDLRFAPGKLSATVTGTLSNDDVMEYAFDARKGQRVTIRNTRPNLFDFRVAGNGDIPFDTEFDSSTTSTFDLPETGNYTFVIRKKRVKKPRTARFSVTLAIK